MEDFANIVLKNYGLKPQGKSAPMSSTKAKPVVGSSRGSACESGGKGEDMFPASNYGGRPKSSSSGLGYDDVFGEGSGPGRVSGFDDLFGGLGINDFKDRTLSPSRLSPPGGSDFASPQLLPGYNSQPVKSGFSGAAKTSPERDPFGTLMDDTLPSASSNSSSSAPFTDGFGELLPGFSSKPVKSKSSGNAKASHERDPFGPLMDLPLPSASRNSNSFVPLNNGLGDFLPGFSSEPVKPKSSGAARASHEQDPFGPLMDHPLPSTSSNSLSSDPVIDPLDIFNVNPVAPVRTTDGPRVYNNTSVHKSNSNGTRKESPPDDLLSAFSFKSGDLKPSDKTDIFVQLVDDSLPSAFSTPGSSAPFTDPLDIFNVAPVAPSAFSNPDHSARFTDPMDIFNVAPVAPSTFSNPGSSAPYIDPLDMFNVAPMAPIKTTDGPPVANNMSGGFDAYDIFAGFSGQSAAVTALRDRELNQQLEQAEKERAADQLASAIKSWAAGKEGNLRALLSSLESVLWPECGWKPVSLADLILADSVKKTYRKATLFVHPDKVQQKGATVEQKYIAEKVFDLLKEAWNKFSSEEPY